MLFFSGRSQGSSVDLEKKICCGQRSSTPGMPSEGGVSEKETGLHYFRVLCLASAGQGRKGLSTFPPRLRVRSLRVPPSAEPVYLEVRASIPGPDLSRGE